MIQPPTKASLCRYFLRGFCLFEQPDCPFAHGIQDLDYQPFSAGDEVQFDYLEDCPFTQLQACKAPRNYINLYRFQDTQKYSLEELNQEREKRAEVRGQLHQAMLWQFMELLEKRYPGANWTV